MIDPMNITSLNRTIQDLSSLERDKVEWELDLSQLTGTTYPEFDTEAQARSAFLYGVQFIHRNRTKEGVKGYVLDRVKSLGDRFGVSINGVTEVSSISPPKPVKVKKTTDKDRVVEWWNDNKESFIGLKPSEVINRMSEELDIHKNSCRSHYHTTNKKFPLVKEGRVISGFNF